MQKINYNNYVKLEDLKQYLDNQNKTKHQFNSKVQDAKFVGSITATQIDPQTNSNINTIYDIYASIEENNNGDTIVKYYLENTNSNAKEGEKWICIAADLPNRDDLIATESFNNNLSNIKNKQDILSKLNEINLDDEISLNEFNKELDKISKEYNISKEQILSDLKEIDAKKDNELEKVSEKLGISKEQILSMSQVDSSTTANKKEDDKIKLQDDKNASQKAKQEQPQNSNEKKDNPNVKQETDLNQKVNNKYTLADILGEKDIKQGDKLVVVYSSAVESNNETTKFSFLIKDANGNFRECKQLQQAGGISPTNDVYASNYDGSSVEKTHVNSMYRAENSDYILTAKTGSMGTIDLGISQAPKLTGLNSGEKSASPVTIPLKTTSTYNTKTETREALLSYNSERYAADKRSKEAKMHDDDCKLTKDEVDGEVSTGHQHEQNVNEINEKILKNLYEEHGDEYFSYESFKSDFIKTYLNGNTNPNNEELTSACERCESEHSRIPNGRR